MNRVTQWRHKTGRSKHRYPKGSVNYLAVSSAILKKYFKHLWQEHRRDAMQECQVLSLEASEKKRIQVGKGKTRRNFGNSRDRIGIKCFSRACQCRLHDMSNRYGYFRPAGSAHYYPRKAWNWGLRDDWLFEVPAFVEKELVLSQVRDLAGAELYDSALSGNAEAIESIRQLIW